MLFLDLPSTGVKVKNVNPKCLSDGEGPVFFFTRLVSKNKIIQPPPTNSGINADPRRFLLSTQDKPFVKVADSTKPQHKNINNEHGLTTMVDIHRNKHSLKQPGTTKNIFFNKTIRNRPTSKLTPHRHQRVGE